jgi:hypothetical protein
MDMLGMFATKKSQFLVENALFRLFGITFQLVYSGIHSACTVVQHF